MQAFFQTCYSLMCTALPGEHCFVEPDRSETCAVLPFSKLNRVFFGYFDPENIFLDNKNK